MYACYYCLSDVDLKIRLGSVIIIYNTNRGDISSYARKLGALI